MLIFVFYFTMIFTTMKIGILGSRGIPNRYGGFEQFAEHLSQGLVKMGADVWVYCSASHPRHTEIWKGINLIYCTDPEDKLSTAGQFIYDLNCIRDSRKRDFDIIYQLGYTSNSVWHSLLPKKPVIVTNMDGLEWKRSKYSKPVQKFLKYAEKLAVMSSDMLIADSEAIKKYLGKEYGSKAHFLPYGVEIFKNPDKNALQKMLLKPYSYYMLMARMQPDNHIEEIIRGVLGANSKFPLVIVGHTGNKFGKYLKQKYESKNIQFKGGIFDQDQLNQLRYFSTLYFHGHSAGGTNPSLLEAMASQALICAHDNQFNREVLLNNAYYFKSPNDILILLESQEEIKKSRQVFINNNLESIGDKYNWPKIISEYYELFRACLFSQDY